VAASQIKQNGGPVSDFEESLLALDIKLDEVQKLGKAVVATIGRTRAAVRVGRVGDIARGLGAISQRADQANAAVGRLANAWIFDASAYMTDGRFVADLKEAAAEKGLRLFENDGRIYCFPLLLRVDPKEIGVRIGRTLERRIRPSQLADLLARAQRRPQRFRETQFLELLYRAWRRLVGANWQETGSGPVVGLADIHEILTLLPGTDYPIEEFGRDLLLLDRRPDLRTRDGCRFEFPASTLSRGRMKRVLVYDERGGERAYIGIRFVKEG
jgi:hypothetical protein